MTTLEINKDTKPSEILGQIQAGAYKWNPSPNDPEGQAWLRNWLLKSAVLGNEYAINRLAQAFEHGWHGLSQDLNKAIKWYRKAAEQGRSGAQSNLDSLHEKVRHEEQELMQQVYRDHEAAGTFTFWEDPDPYDTWYLGEYLKDDIAEESRIEEDNGDAQLEYQHLEWELSR